VQLPSCQANRLGQRTIAAAYAITETVRSFEDEHSEVALAGAVETRW